MAISLSLKRRRDDKDEEFLLFPEAGHLRPVAHDEPSAGAAWLGAEDEGRLAVDVLETEKEIVIKSAIAGVKPEDLEVFVHDDMLTIRGTRHADVHEEKDARHLVRECHWGSFSRSVILPTEIDVEKIAATIRDGVLVVRLPKTHRNKRISVREA